MSALSLIGRQSVLKSISYFFVLVVLLITPFTFAQNSPFKITWTGVAGILIDDGEQVLAFDVTFTKPTLGHWLFNKPFISDEKLVLEKIKAFSINKIDALFASHTHFDHAVDIAFLASHFQSTVYAGASLQHLVKSYSIQFKKNITLQEIALDKPIQVGKFKITLFVRPHAPILKFLNWHFAQGEVPTNTRLNFYDYRVGETWCFLIEHPKGNLFIDQGGVPNFEIIKKIPPIDIAMLGVANKVSLANWSEGYIKLLKPKKIIPLHYDWFLLSFPEKPFIMWNSDLDKIKEITKSQQIEFLTHL